ncbi:hypothetical protein QBC35DRAFT_448829 [Podospora australis]|uniref:Uncharacterized protein n=1 Tax=Podospora australis TaxID=1536484 RepID=A0AAN7ALA9_9PEZI|nr:hypothetical protein QBC35DRAFT_448829 [Podospora australis]
MSTTILRGFKVSIPTLDAANVPAQQPGLPPIPVPRRDVLWIECKSAPYGWNLLLEQCVDRLAVAHPDLEVWMILAIGMKWIPLIWRPSHRLGSNGLQMLQDDMTEVDDRIHEVPLATLPGQRHMINKNGRRVINPALAYGLDYWTQNAAGQAADANTPDLVLLERFFTAIQHHVFVGANPSHFY